MKRLHTSDEPGLASSVCFTLGFDPVLVPAEENLLGDKWHRIFTGHTSSCHPINWSKHGRKHNYLNQWHYPVFVLQWISTERALLPSCQLSVAILFSVLLSSITTHDTEHLPGPSVGLSVGRSVGLQSVLWQNGWADLDVIWGCEWGRSRKGCIRWRWLSSKGQFLGVNVWYPIVTNGAFVV